MSKLSAWPQRLLAGMLAWGLLAVQTGCRAEQPWPLWQSYRARFIDRASGRVIDHSAGDRTTSEGMAYAMFFALVVNDRATFDKLLRWTEDNLAGGDLTARLPSWNWGKSQDGSWKTLDSNSAADADLWMAYDLLEAGRLWKDGRLSKLGGVLADRIAHSETADVPGVGTVVLPGAQGFAHLPGGVLLNPSYLPPQVIARLHDEAPTGPWGAVLMSLPVLLKESSPSGYAMDWVAAGNGVHASGTPQELAQGQADAVPVGSYEAIRVYLWLGMADRDTESVGKALSAVSGMAGYLHSNMTPPLQVTADGKVPNPDGNVGFSAAVMPYLIAMNHKDEAKTQGNRLAANFDSATGLYGRNPTYYDQNLALFSTGWQEGRFRFDRDGKLQLKWK